MPRACTVTGSFTTRVGVAGQGLVQVTATDNDAISWDYEIRTPAGTFRVPIPWSEAGWSLRELIDEHHPGPRPPHRR
jgi:hypothetical protein